ncbi:hypothetical protein ACIO3S_17305 [Nocardioides sp. NPDC087217]|uniref:hypothetical protein n=1 Tax=Nocardioides sp. NPDC087217 TaxID=3364335 RepID=UPI00381AB5EA
MSDDRCQACEQYRRELYLLRDRLGQMTQGLAAVVVLLDAEQVEPSMPKQRLLAVVHHRLTHLLNQTR